MNDDSAALRHEEAPELVKRVWAYRRAARVAVEAPRDLRVRLVALVDLMGAARREEDPTLRSWCERVVREEARPLLGEDSPPAVPGDSYERRARALRAEGNSRCPCCLGEIATEVDIARWTRLRASWLEELEARRGAVR